MNETNNCTLWPERRKRFSGTGVLTRAESLLCFTGKGALFYRAVRTRRSEYTYKGNANISNDFSIG